MVLAEHEILNLALEALRGKLALPETAVIQRRTIHTRILMQPFKS